MMGRRHVTGDGQRKKKDVQSKRALLSSALPKLLATVCNNAQRSVVMLVGAMGGLRRW